MTRVPSFPPNPAGRRPASHYIPEEIQAPWRERLRMLRQHARLNLNSLKCLSAGTLGVYETKDISTLTLGTMVAMSAEFGLTSKEFISYLCGEDDLPLRDQSADRLLTVFRLLDQELQDLAYNLLRTLYIHAEKNPPKSNIPHTSDAAAELIARLRHSCNLRDDLTLLDEVLNG